MSQVEPVEAKEAEEKRTFLRWQYIFKNVVFATLSIVFILFLAGYIYIIRTYTTTFLEILSWRKVTYGALAVICILFACIYYSVVEVIEAVQGKIVRKPFERQVEFRTKLRRLLYEIFDTNGKYYLLRLFGGELVEMAYQFWNFTYFRCSLKSSYLCIYCLFLVVECAMICKNMFPLNQPLGVNNKNQAILLDICMEVFSCAYPLLILFAAQKIPISEDELFQIIGFPTFMLILKFKVLWTNQVVLALYKQRLHDFVKDAKTDQTKKKRRTSFAVRETQVVGVQNEYFPRWAKLTMVSVTAFAGVVYLYSFLLVSGYSLFHTYKQSMRFCLVDVPLCNDGFLPQDNCASLKALRTTDKNQQQIFEDATEMSALQIVKVSGINDVSKLSKNPWKGIKEMWIFNSPLQEFDVDVSTWTTLFRMRFFNLSNFTNMHASVLSTTSFELRIQQCPKFVCPPVRNPSLRGLLLTSLQGVDVSGWDAPLLKNVMLMDVNITTLPPLPDLISLNVAMNPHLQVSTMPIVTYYVDMRQNHISDATGEEYEKLRFKYGTGPSCPTTWNCSGFCKPTCIGYSTTVCLPTCIFGACGITPPCAAEFDDL